MVLWTFLQLHVGATCHYKIFKSVLAGAIISRPIGHAVIKLIEMLGPSVRSESSQPQQRRSSFFALNLIKVMHCMERYL